MKVAGYHVDSSRVGWGGNPGPWSSMTALLDEIILNTELFVPIHVLGDSLEEGIMKLQLVVYNNYHLKHNRFHAVLCYAY